MTTTALQNQNSVQVNKGTHFHWSTYYVEWIETTTALKQPFQAYCSLKTSVHIIQQHLYKSPETHKVCEIQPSLQISRFTSNLKFPKVCPITSRNNVKPSVYSITHPLRLKATPLMQTERRVGPSMPPCGTTQCTALGVVTLTHEKPLAELHHRQDHAASAEWCPEFQRCDV